MTFNDVLWGFFATFAFLAAFVFLSLETRHYFKKDEVARMRAWAIIYSLLAIWSFVWANSTGS